MNAQHKSSFYKFVRGRAVGEESLDPQIWGLRWASLHWPLPGSAPANWSETSFLRSPSASLTASRINMCAVKWAFFIYTNYASGIKLTMLIIREWNCQEGPNLLFNCHYDPSVLWDIFGKLDSKQPIQTFLNTRAILQYIYFTYMKWNLNIFTCTEDAKPVSDYCRDSVSNGQENTTRIAVSTSFTQFFMWKGSESWI